MQRTLALLALVASALAIPSPAGVTSAISPSSPAPSGCSASHSGSFEITVVNVTTSKKRDLESVSIFPTPNFTIILTSGSVMP